MPVPHSNELALDILERLTAISSPSHDQRGIRRCLACLQEILTSVGLPASVDTDDLGSPTLPVLVGGDLDARRPLLIVGHIDTVLPAAHSRRDGDRFYATGAIDMKGGLAAFCGALNSLSRRGDQRPDDLLLVIVPDEEVGGVGTESVVNRLGARARALWVLEPGSRICDRAGEELAETLVIGRRGLSSFSLRVHGKAAHSGIDFWSGKSALLAAAEWSLQATEMSVDVAGGPTVNIGRLVAGSDPFVSELEAHASLVGSGAQVNAVADAAVAEGEARVLTSNETTPLLRRLSSMATRIAGERGVEMDFEVGATISPLEPTARRQSYAQRACDLADERGWRLDLEDDRGGVSFPNFLPAGCEIPVLDGLGPVGGGMHSPGEYVIVPSLARRVALLADLLVGESTAPNR